MGFGFPALLQSGAAVRGPLRIEGRRRWTTVVLHPAELDWLREALALDLADDETLTTRTSYPWAVSTAAMNVITARYAVAVPGRPWPAPHRWSVYDRSPEAPTPSIRHRVPLLQRNDWMERSAPTLLARSRIAGDGRTKRAEWALIPDSSPPFRAFPWSRSAATATVMHGVRQGS